MFQVTSKGEGFSLLNSLKNFFRFNSYSSNKKLPFVFLILLFVFLIFWYFNPLVIVVNGKGEISATPDGAKISYVVTGLGSSVNEAVSDVQSRQNRIRSVVINTFLVSESDLTESQISVIPPTLSQSGGKYAASLSAEVKIEDYTQATSLISSLYSEGVSYVSQPILFVRDTKSLEYQAYTLAIEDADSKISNISKKHLRFLRKRVSISVVNSNSEAVTTTKESAIKGDETSSLLSDSLKITSFTTVTYKLW